MKSKLTLVLFGVCFSLFLFLGIRASQAVFDDSPVSLDRPTSGPVLLEAPTGEPGPLDPFSLIILVDDLTNPAPVLEGVWLSRSSDRGRAQLFFPLFPSQAEDGAQRDLELREEFWLAGSDQPSQVFFGILSSRNLVWHQVLVLDYHTLAEIGLILSELNPDYRALNQVGLASLAYSIENRLLVQNNQALLIHDICQQLPLPAQNELLQRFLEGFAGHLLLEGAEPLGFTRSWSETRYCQFPTMTLSPP